MEHLACHRIHTHGDGGVGSQDEVPRNVLQFTFQGRDARSARFVENPVEVGEAAGAEHERHEILESHVFQEREESGSVTQMRFGKQTPDLGEGRVSKTWWRDEESALGFSMDVFLEGPFEIQVHDLSRSQHGVFGIEYGHLEKIFFLVESVVEGNGFPLLEIATQRNDEGTPVLASVVFSRAG